MTPLADVPVLDVVIVRACGAAVALVLLLGAIDKLRDRALFAAVLDDYRIVPEAAGVWLARLVPWTEIAAAALLLWPTTRALGAVLAVALLAAFSVAVAINLLRGRRDIDCGCGGASGTQALSWFLVARNGALVLLALAGAADGAPRATTWLDVCTALAATLALLALYVAGNQLWANRPRLQALRRGPA